MATEEKNNNGGGVGVGDVGVVVNGAGGDAKAGGGGQAIRFGSKPTLIVHPPLKFLIMDAPKKENLHLYVSRVM